MSEESTRNLEGTLASVGKGVDAERFVNEHESKYRFFYEYLRDYIAENGLDATDVITKSRISKNYVYQIRVGGFWGRIGARSGSVGAPTWEEGMLEIRADAVGQHHRQLCGKASAVQHAAVFAVDIYRAGDGGQMPGDAFQDRRFARAVGTDQR